MKLQIDTAAKTIKLEQSAKITEILSVVKKLLPNDWKDYSLEAVVVLNNWYEPITFPTWPPQVIYHSMPTGNTFDLDLKGMDKTICNIEINN